MDIRDFIKNTAIKLEQLTYRGAVGMGIGYLAGRFIFHALPLTTGVIGAVTEVGRTGIALICHELVKKGIIKYSTSCFIQAASEAVTATAAITALVAFGIIGPVGIAVLSGLAAAGVITTLAEGCAVKYVEWGGCAKCEVKYAETQNQPLQEQTA